MIRQPARRLFAEEFNASWYQIKGGGQREPSFLITPLGAKVNRVLILGTLTQKDMVSEGVLRGRVTDPTGTFTIYAGQYQPEASRTLADLSAPSLVAIVGKPRVYKPEENVTYVSITPELIVPADQQTRDYWVLETCRSLRDRLEAIREALGLEKPTKEAMLSLGYDVVVAETICIALDKYKPEVNKYEQLLRHALQYLLPEVREAEEAIKAGKKAPAEIPDEEKEKVLSIVESLDRGEGATWEDVIRVAKERNISEDRVEEIVNSLMAEGRVYEPVLGRLKKI